MAIPAEAAARLETAFARFESELARTAAEPGVDEVHDVRVSIRRLEQALDVFARWLPARESGRTVARLRTVLDRAGEVRDRDIALELISSLELTVAPAVPEALRGERENSSRRLSAPAKKLIDAKAAAAWMERLRLGKREQTAALGSLASALLPLLARDFIASGAKLAERGKSRRRLHRFRVAGKRFRYTMELFSDLYPAAIAERVATVRKVQTSLGDLQDCVATRRLLREAGVAGDVMEPLRREEKKRLASFRALWPQLFDDNAAREWRRFLKHPERRAPARKRAR